jgi:alpha-1,3-rhamnosyl/mannosyltransferase
VRRLVWRLGPRRIAATCRFVAATASELRGRRRCTELTVGVDVNPLWEPLTGVGWYLYLLLRGLAERDGARLRLYGPDLVGDGGGAPPVVELPSGDAVEVVRYVVPHDLSLPPSLVVRCLRLLEPLLVAADRNRVLFAPNFFLPRRFALARGAVVATVHDLAFERFPWTVREETRRDLVRHENRTLESACRIITPSRSVRRELVEEGMITAERVVAVYHGPGHLAAGATELAAAVALPLPAGVSRPYVLHVGTLEPRKNLAMLLGAWHRARARSDAVPPLVLGGGFGWKSDELRSAVERAQREGWAIHPGYVDDATLAALYAGALFVVCPSLYEGFGLPVVEAMRLGAPVLCSDIPVFREVAADGARFVPPDDQEAWSEALVELSEDEGVRARLAGAGRTVAAGLSWSRAVVETLEVLRDAGATVRRQGH